MVSLNPLSILAWFLGWWNVSWGTFKEWNVRLRRIYKNPQTRQKRGSIKRGHMLRNIPDSPHSACGTNSGRNQWRHLVNTCWRGPNLYIHFMLLYLYIKHNLWFLFCVLATLYSTKQGLTQCVHKEQLKGSTCTGICDV